jgi:transaldolase
LLASTRWKRLLDARVPLQRLLWASTGTKDPAAPPSLYVEALAAPFTINTMPEKTLQVFAEQGELSGVMSADGGDAEQVLAAFAAEGVNDAALAAQLQVEGTQAFAKSWQELLHVLAAKGMTQKLAGAAR